MSLRQEWEPEATKLAVSSDPEQWILLNLEEVLVGKVYAEPVRFIPQPFKRQQEAIAEQLEAEFARQGGLSERLIEEQAA